MTISKHLPNKIKTEDKKMIQIRMDPKLYEQLKEKLTKNGVFMSDFMQACALMYLEEK